MTYMQTIPGSVLENIVERHQTGRDEVVYKHLPSPPSLQLWPVVLKTIKDFPLKVQNHSSHHFLQCWLYFFKSSLNSSWWLCILNFYTILWFMMGGWLWWVFPLSSENTFLFLSIFLMWGLLSEHLKLASERIWIWALLSCVAKMAIGRWCVWRQCKAGILV